jgi:TRAP-type C4-dicarboxylate transport system permease small subunit
MTDVAIGANASSALRGGVMMLAGLQSVKKAVYAVSAALNLAGVFLIIFMTATIVVDVLGRLLFNLPLQGSYELVEYAMSLVIVFALGYTQVVKGHINVDSVLRLLPRKAQTVAMQVVNFIGLGMFAVIAWQTFVKAGLEVTSGTNSAVLGIAKYPFMYLSAFGFSLLCLVYIMQILLPDETEAS